MASSLAPRLLYVIPQLPLDPSSGATRSMQTVCEILAAAGFQVRAVATTSTAHAARFDAGAFFESLGIHVETDPGRTKARVRPELRFRYRGVDYHLLDVGHRDLGAWERVHGRQFDLLFDDELHAFKPDLLLAFGGMPAEVRRYERARRQGARIIFGLRNESYLAGKSLLATMDGILTPSQFLTDYYRSAIGIDSTALPTPIELADVLAEEHDPIFVTMINPVREKGLMLLARLAEELSIQRPDIPMLIVESRGSAGKLVEAGMLAGFDLRRHENLMLSPSMAQPKEIYTATRVLLAPSLVREASGRVAAEALINGIPPLVSDRGGLPETCNGAGFTLAVPPEITLQYSVPVSAGIVQPWLDLIFRLEGDEEFYREQSRLAREAARIYHPAVLAPRYVEYFENFLR